MPYLLCSKTFSNKQKEVVIPTNFNIQQARELKIEPFYFANHSENNNIEYKLSSQGKVHLYSNQDIKSQSELLAD